MDRRSFIKSIVGLAATTFLPLNWVPVPIKKAIHKKALSYSELDKITYQYWMPAIKDQCFAGSPLLKQMMLKNLKGQCRVNGGTKIRIPLETPSRDI